MYHQGDMDVLVRHERMLPLKKVWLVADPMLELPNRCCSMRTWSSKTTKKKWAKRNRMDVRVEHCYLLVVTNGLRTWKWTIESSWVFPLIMGMFHGYVSLPEGMSGNQTWLAGKILYQWRFLVRKTMFDYCRVTTKQVDFQLAKSTASCFRCVP